MCLPVLKEGNKSRFDRYSGQKQCIDHIPHYLSGLLRAHFSDNLSRHSCQDEDKYDNRLILLIILNSKLPVQT